MLCAAYLAMATGTNPAGKKLVLGAAVAAAHLCQRWPAEVQAVDDASNRLWC